MKIILDENGQITDELAEKNERIKAELQQTLDDFLAEKEKSKGKVNLGYRFTKQIYIPLCKNGMISANDFMTLKEDYDTLYDYWLKYQELIAYYNRYFEIVDNKQLFMAYVGINLRQYRELEKSKNEEIAALMDNINSIFVGMAFMASESGNASVAAVTTRLSAKDVGHNVVSASQSQLAEALSTQTPQEIEREIERLAGGFGEIKKLENKTKK